MSTQVWSVFDEQAGIWIADYRVGAARARSICVRLVNDNYAIVSPGKSLATKSKDFFAKNVPQILVAPNSVHNMGLKAWQESFTNAISVCSHAAKKRLRKLGHTNMQNLKSLKTLLPDYINIVEVPGSRLGEIWFVVKGEKGTTWIVCDGMMNICILPKNIFGRTLLRFLNMAPGLRFTRQWKWLFIKSRRNFRKWILGLLDSHPPQNLIPAHGDIISQQDLTQKIRQQITKSFG
ncbi:hypothetical protein [Candidatus Uabimicrobium amorphum]|uniref:Uncharacterized protein n=1 Tax=Uabimicrobium amorphum TaxID=2596890 RepID=A0A5S9F595_UABAM|nr:hypothetical protein [Candidatus Uabimicrobium amorphum]BBM86372.1 hypothetical protein UABAM_04758 [Candidatus Uabimicrobium amorphum]